MKKLKTIYEFFDGYSENEVNKIIQILSEEEKDIIKSRYGNDLYNPSSLDDWNKEKSNIFYGRIIPKIRKLLIQKNEKQKTVMVDGNNFMSFDLSYKILNLIRQKLNSTEICRYLNIDYKILYNELLKLKSMGITIDKRYGNDGSIRYYNNKKEDETKFNKASSFRRINMGRDVDELKVLAISDIHFGNSLERVDLVNRAFNYCVKNGIHSIFCGGDFIDGRFSKGVQKIPNMQEQVEYFINNYPHDESILTFGVGGDHDYSVYDSIGIDIREVCENFRQDIIIPAYNNAYVNIQMDTINLHHFLPDGGWNTNNVSMEINGHKHAYSTRLNEHGLKINLPSLSDIMEVVPSALELTLSLKDGYIDTVYIKQICFGDVDFVMSESEFLLPQKKKYRDEKHLDEIITSSDEYKRTYRK